MLALLVVAVSIAIAPPAAAQEIRHDTRLLRISELAVNDGVTDGASGDGDGIAECGETIVVEVTLAISWYRPRLSLFEPAVTVDARSRIATLVGNDTSLPAGWLTPGETLTLPNRFRVEIDGDAPAGESIYFVTDVASSNRDDVFRLHRHIPVMCGVDGPIDVAADGDPYDNTYPVPPITMPMFGAPSYTSTWLADRDEYIHEGVDIFEDQMTPVLAAADGYVSGVLWQNDLARDDPIGCCSVSIIHDDGWESWYIHLNNDTPFTDDDRGDADPANWHLAYVPRLEPGERVRAGEIIGWVGNSGNAKYTPHHIHYELHDPAGNPVNPYVALLEARRPAHPVTCSDSEGVCRVYGADRYETAVAVSRESNPGGAPTVYVAVGTNFPDAIAAGPAAAAEDAPILLTEGSSVPDSTMNELQRLGPSKVVVVGGPEAVSDSVVAVLESGLPDADVVRRAGIDRYETAVEVSSAAFARAGTAFVATGESFADAVVAASGAVKVGVPLLLVPPSGLDGSIRGEIERLGVASVVIIGGTSAVPGSVESELEELGMSVERVSGANRYSGSAAFSRSVWRDGASTVYIAVGTDFPDALTGGPLTRIGDGPLLLTEKLYLHPAVSDEIVRLEPDRIVVLGGPAAVSETIWWVLAGHLG